MEGFWGAIDLVAWCLFSDCFYDIGFWHDNLDLSGGGSGHRTRMACVPVTLYIMLAGIWREF